jgi:hypothetical protein
MSSSKVTTETTGDITEVTVEGLLTMTIHNGQAVIVMDSPKVHVDRDLPLNLLTISPIHPRLAYVAPELHDEFRAELNLTN